MEKLQQPDLKELRIFGLMAAAFLAVIFGTLLPFLLGFGYKAWPWIVAGILVIWALAAPRTLGPVYSIWLKAGLLIGTVVNTLILSAVFLLLILPTGLVMRLLRKDPMRRSLDHEQESYRNPSVSREPGHMKHPY